MPSNRFYRRDQDDKINTINRCFADAEQGRIELALVRIGDVLEEFPNDASVLYARGLLQRDFLGKGLESRNDFEKAFRFASAGAEVRGLAACNAAARIARSPVSVEALPSTSRSIPPSSVSASSFSPS